MKISKNYLLYLCFIISIIYFLIAFKNLLINLKDNNFENEQKQKNYIFEKKYLISDNNNINFGFLNISYMKSLKTDLYIEIHLKIKNNNKLLNYNANISVFSDLLDFIDVFNVTINELNEKQNFFCFGKIINNKLILKLSDSKTKITKEFNIKNKIKLYNPICFDFLKDLKEFDYRFENGLNIKINKLQDITINKNKLKQYEFIVFNKKIITYLNENFELYGLNFLEKVQIVADNKIPKDVKMDYYSINFNVFELMSFLYKQ